MNSIENFLEYLMKTIQSIEVNINQVITGVFYFSQAETKIHHIYCTIVN